MRNEEPGGIGINGVVPGDGQCVIPNCVEETPINLLMCRWHWGEVPAELRSELLRVMKLWHRGVANLEELREAQWACVESLIWSE